MNRGKKAWAILIALVGVSLVYISTLFIRADSTRGAEEGQKWLGAIAFAVVGINMTIPCVGYLFKARWVRWAVLVPLWFFELGCVMAAYGLFLARDLSLGIALGVSGILLAIISLGYFFKAKWARFIVGAVATLGGLGGLIGGIIAALGGAFYGEPELMYLFGAGLLLMLLWGIETLVRVFREDFRLLSKPAGSRPSLPGQQEYPPRSVRSIKLADRDKGKEDAKLQELEDELMPFHQVKVDYVDAANRRDQTKVNRLLGAIVLCESCNKGIRVQSARRQDGSLVCPYCGVEWVSGDDLAAGM